VKFQGKDLSIRDYIKVRIPRTNCPSIELRVNALPIGIQRDFQSLCPRPIAPFVIKNIKGQGEKKESDYDNPQFLADLADYNDLQRYYMLYVALKDNPELEFNFVPKDVMSLKNFRQEVKDAGFTEGDANIILNASAKVSNITDEDVNKAQETF
jgi:hypothetical protein